MCRSLTGLGSLTVSRSRSMVCEFYRIRHSATSVVCRPQLHHGNCDKP